MATTQERLETLSPRKSSRIRDPAVSDAAVEEKIKKSKKTNLASPVNNPVWRDEDEVFVLKKLVDFRGQSGNGSEIDCDNFYGFIKTSIAGKFSKKQVLRKIKELRRKYVEHSENLKRENDPKFTKCTDSEAFGYSVMIWGLIYSESDHPERLKDHGKLLNDSGVPKLKENESLLETQQRYKEKELVSTGKESQDYDELATLRDAFGTLVSSGLSDHRKKLQLEKLMYLEAGTKRQLSDEWRAICAEEIELKIPKFQFSVMLAKAAETVTIS